MRAPPEAHSWLEALRIPLAAEAEREVRPGVGGLDKEEPTELVNFVNLIRPVVT